MAEINNNLLVLSNQRTYFLATLYKFTRADSTTFYYTDHNVEISFEGNTYTPAGGMDASAIQKKQNTGVDNMNLKGFISHDDITIEDLRAGLYSDSTLVVYKVDYRWPYRGWHVKDTFYVSEIRYDGDLWAAEMVGITDKLNKEVGKIYSPICPYQLGDSDCGKDLTNFTHTGTVTVVTDTRAVFTLSVSGLSSKSSNYLTYGKATWLTGNNVGQVTEIATQSSPSGDTAVVTLSVDTFKDIQVGDTATVISGCDREASTCSSLYDNIKRFGGYPTIPGTLKSIETPEAK